MAFCETLETQLRHIREMGTSGGLSLHDEERRKERKNCHNNGTVNLQGKKFSRVVSMNALEARTRKWGWEAAKKCQDCKTVAQLLRCMWVGGGRGLNS